jgi:deoxyhypusine synthase
VKDFIPKKQTVDELVKNLKNTSFNARSLGEASDIIEGMIRDKGCVKFLGLSGALIASGMRACVVEMIKQGWVDIIVSTGAIVTHDMAQCYGERFMQIDPLHVDDLKLRAKGFDRIYDTISSVKTMAIMEKNIQKIFGKMKDGEYASYEIMNEIGKQLDDKNSIVCSAARKNVKIIVPAFVDSIIGMQFWMHSQDHAIKINEMRDLDYVINLNFDLKEQKRNSGAVILGGGVPKNFILQSVLMADKPHRYVVQLTTERPEFGGLSGATLEEAKSWGKVDKDSRLSVVYCDYSIAFPIIISALKERF